MWKQTIGNATQFPFQEVQVDGVLPKGIRGRYFRNGSGRQTIGKDVLNHWFLGDGAVFMLEIRDDKCWAQLKFVETQQFNQRSEKQKLSTNFITKFQKRPRNPANTSVLPLKDSENFLALAQSGVPFVMRKKDLSSIGQDNFGFINSAYSAHPKVDPMNGDIFNIGTDFQKWTLNLTHSTKEMKFVKSHTIKLRSLQSIHDFCLAGDYIVIFECPMNLSYWGLLFSPTMFQTITFNEKLTKLVHIFKKSDFTHIRTIETPSSYVFHFSNGCSFENKILIQYCNYHPQEAKQIFSLLEHMPQYANGSEREFEVVSHLEEMEIDLETGKFKITDLEGSAEFPVVEDHEVGKQWRYTYTGLYEKKFSYLNKIGKYDRVEKKWVAVRDLGEGRHVGEPAIIRVEEKVYLLAIVNEKKSSQVFFFDGDNLQILCKVKLPEFVPSGFHGKWDIEL